MKRDTYDRLANLEGGQATIAAPIPPGTSVREYLAGLSDRELDALLASAGEPYVPVERITDAELDELLALKNPVHVRTALARLEAKYATPRGGPTGDA